MPWFLVFRRLFKRLTRRRELILVGVAFSILLIGAVLFSLAEHVSFGMAVYWSVVTATTVGYGDVTPHNTAGRVIASGVMLTTIPIVGAVFALLAGASAVRRLRRLMGMEPGVPDGEYVVAYGTHPVLTRVLTELAGGDEEVVLVAPERPVEVPDTVHLVAGDPTSEDLIRRSQPQGACRALIACEADADTLVVAVALHDLAPKLEIAALTQSARVAGALRELGVTLTLSSDELVGHTLAKSLQTPLAGNLLLQMVDSNRYRLHEIPVAETLVSKPLSSARSLAGQMVLGIVRGTQVDMGVHDDPVLAAGDRLIVLEPASPQ